MRLFTDAATWLLDAVADPLSRAGHRDRWS